ncbi:cobalamin biosynthesis protein CbiM [Thermococcus peptonophilus]|uniref:Cobalamin biosynthesis protein CbiM n=1 Tax=Thermococcus peptonophilus TaxID=53952 RepID=A0A142CXB3_9EURY|nr:cobalamin biosynthesis protein CbiM [Thermococcus peptonophilus]
MHIPDGYLGPYTCAFFYAVMVPIWYKAFKWLKKLKPAQVPLLGVLTALAFLVMMYNLPVPGGTTAHIVGGTIIAILIDPWAATVALTIVLLIQALFFGDGGITSYAANVFNMGVVLPFVGYYTYKALTKAGISEVLSAGIGAYVGIVAAAIAAGIELGVQPLLQPGYSPYPLSVSVPAMAIAHLVTAGPAAAVVTAAVVWYVKRSRPDLFGMRAIAGTR